ncbi:MAG: ABC transporter ATP-binding protein [Xanthomonadaceae bacterium]|jgi:iron(III) transport system ATP-binding protein|nr:ABC transporter ATP-binding protein [Xanthomonadaceae bacterium]
MRADAPLLAVDSLACRIGGAPVVDGVDFALARGELAALLGPSGCGKTTTLRAIAGFHRPQSGRVVLRGAVVAGDGIDLAPERRAIGFVFQDLALFPHLDVAGNVGFGLRALPRDERAARVADLLARLELDGLATRRPHELSGGQQQRVAVARALAPRPDLLLLDEPFSSLDARLRVRLREAVRDVLRALGVAALLVTHDQDEAFAFADRVGVMHAGRIAQWDTPYAIYHRPATPFVAGFVGGGRLLPGTVRTDGAIDTVLGPLRPTGAALPPGAAVRVLLRPDDLRPDAAGPLRARVVDAAFRGAETLYRLRLADGTEVEALFPSHHAHAPGTEVGLRTDLEHVVAFAAE